MITPSPSPPRRTLIGSLRTVLKDESGHQIEPLLFVAFVGILAAIAIPELVRGQLSLAAILIHAGVLAAGSGLFTFIHNRIVDEGDQLPGKLALFPSIVGLIFVNRFGRVSTGIVLGIYGVACLHDAFEKRRRRRERGG